eukprot:10239085-Heterocapsa_arctica.AAC.1
MRTSTAWGAPSTHRASTITAHSPTFYCMIDVKKFKLRAFFQLAHVSALLARGALIIFCERAAGQGGPDDFL